MSGMKRILISTGLLLILLLPSRSEGVCVPTGFDPISMVNWHSIFPISIAGKNVVPSADVVKTVSLAKSPVCACPIPIPPFIRPGIPIGFWEPARLVETVKDAWCFPSIGVEFDLLPGAMLDGTTGLSRSNVEETFAQAHYFIFPVWAMLELLKDLVCVEGSGFDVAYITELDPLWQSDILTAIIQPEAILFANPVSQLACIADSVSSTAGLSLSPLFWCMGSWGSAYPLTGHIGSADYVEANAGIAARLIYKLSRQLLICDTNVTLCSCVPTPIWVKHNYKLHVAKPVKDFSSHPIGRSGLLWAYLKNPPYAGDNFVWVLFRRVGCCAF